MTAKRIFDLAQETSQNPIDLVMADNSGNTAAQSMLITDMFAGYGCVKLVTKPTTTGFTLNNAGGTGSVDTSGPGIALVDTGGQGGVDAARVYAKTIGAATYTITLGFINNFNFAGATFPNGGLALYDGTKMETLTLLNVVSGNNWQINIYDWSNVTSASAIVQCHPAVFINPIWFQVVEDGVHRTWNLSADGVRFFQYAQFATNTFLTPTQAGYYIDNVGTAAGAESSLRVIHWSIV